MLYLSGATYRLGQCQNTPGVKADVTVFKNVVYGVYLTHITLALLRLWLFSC